MTAFDVLRLLVGVPLVLLVPGWLWSLAAFPRSRPLGADRVERAELDPIERTAVSLALSVAVVSLGALLWNGAFGLPLGTWGSLALVATLAGIGLAAWRWRVRRAPR
jgi:uncharacterized membrane protein